MKISKNKKIRFFLMSQGSLDPKIRFIGQKVCYVARVQTHRHTDRHESEYRGLFSIFFLQPIIKDQSKKPKQKKNSHTFFSCLRD